MDRALETLVTLAGLYLFLSLVAMAIVEGLSSMLDMRARLFEKGVKALLGSKARTVLEGDLFKSLGRASGRKSGLPSYIPPEMFTTAVMEIVAGKEVAAAQAAAAGAPALQKIVEQAGGDARALRTRIEAWFDAGMERLSGQYKRSIQRITRVVAILAVVFLNADSIEIGQRVWSEPTVREGALLYSQKLIELCKPDGAGKVVCPGVTSSSDEAAASYPLGWTWPKVRALDGAGDIFYKLIGLLLTALAGSLGAPFWFDVLRRVAPGLPQAGPRPEGIPITAAAMRQAAGAALADAPSAARLELVGGDEPARHR